MHVVSLHPIDLDVVHAYVSDLTRAPVPGGGALNAARGGSEPAANQVTYGLAEALSGVGPMFVHTDFGLTFWEAQVDRPIGMLMRPPARLFVDAGLDAGAARAMPIRLDPQMGMMAGAYIPARLVGKALDQLDEHLERSVKRLVEAEVDPVPVVGLMQEALAYAHERGMGLLEAQDVVGPYGEGRPGAHVIMPDRKRFDRDLVERVVTYATPPKKPGLLQRMFGRSETTGSNGQHRP